MRVSFLYPVPATVGYQWSVKGSQPELFVNKVKENIRRHLYGLKS